MPSINEQYIDLLKAFRAAVDRLNETAETINKVGSALTKGSFRFTTSEVSLPANTLAIDQEESTVRVDQWPNAGDIMLIQKAVCDARAKLMNFYNALPATERNAMKPLPQDVQSSRTALRKK